MNTFGSGNSIDDIFGNPVVNAFGQRIGTAYNGLFRDELIFRDRLGERSNSGHIGLDGHGVWSGKRPIGTIGVDGQILLR